MSVEETFTTQAEAALTDEAARVARGRRLKEIASARGIGWPELADAANIQVGSIRKMARRGFRAFADCDADQQVTLKAVAKVLQIPMTELEPECLGHPVPPPQLSHKSAPKVEHDQMLDMARQALAGPQGPFLRDAIRLAYVAAIGSVSAPR